jgi:hypothetical protein
MDFIIIYSDMAGGTQALEINADSWEAANDGLIQRLRDNQEAVEGVDKNTLNFFPIMLINAKATEIRRYVPYVDPASLTFIESVPKEEPEG